ncbi:MAG: GNAT family N-acetyltransferase, partial [Lysinibacillus sp.]
NVYENCIEHAITTDSVLPVWYLLLDGEKIIGCTGLITNDFISRMDLWPWICALYIEPEYRGLRYSKLLLDQAKHDAKNAGFSSVYLCTNHIGLYEKYGFDFIGIGYHPWGDSSRVYWCEM